MRTRWLWVLSGQNHVQLRNCSVFWGLSTFILKGRSAGPSGGRGDRGCPPYQVRQLLDSRVQQGSMQYLVDWEGYGPEEWCWIPAQDILNHYLIDELYRAWPDQTSLKWLPSWLPMPWSGARVTGPRKSLLSGKVCSLYKMCIYFPLENQQNKAYLHLSILKTKRMRMLKGYENAMLYHLSYHLLWKGEGLMLWTYSCSKNFFWPLNSQWHGRCWSSVEDSFFNITLKHFLNHNYGIWHHS